MSDSTNEGASGAAPVDEGPNGHGSLGRLIPWPDESTYPNIPADEALELFLGWVESRGIELWPHQEEALLDLAAGDNLILGTPTGSGKSMVALGLAFMSVCTDRRSYYTAPIKALVSEKFFDFVELFGKESTGKVFINDCTCTFQVVALAHNRDSTAATGNYKVTGVNHCTDCTDLNDLLRFWRSYNTTVSASCIFFHDIIIFFSHNISFFLRKEFTNWLGWCFESRIISIYTNLSDHCSNRNIMDSSVEQFFSQGILQVISDVSLAHCNTYRKWCVWLFLILMC